MTFAAKVTAVIFSVSLLAGGLTIAKMMTPPAAAQASSAKTTVDRAKSDGLIGEQIDGYLGAVKPGISADVQAAMNEINILRKQAYTQLANQQGVSVTVVAALSGEKLVAKAGPGEMVKLSDGQWHTAGSIR